MNIFFLNFEFYIFLIFFSFSEINEFLLFDNLYIDVVNFWFLEKTFWYISFNIFFKIIFNFENCWFIFSFISLIFELIKTSFFFWNSSIFFSNFSLNFFKIFFELKLLKSGNDSFNLLIKESSSFKYSFSLILFSDKETIFNSLIFNWISMKIKLFSIKIVWFFLILLNYHNIRNIKLYYHIISSKFSI